MSYDTNIILLRGAHSLMDMMSFVCMTMVASSPPPSSPVAFLWVISLRGGDYCARHLGIRENDDDAVLRWRRCLSGERVGGRATSLLADWWEGGGVEY